MNKTEIKAELRRSACEDEGPIFGLAMEAWSYMIKEEFRRSGVDLFSSDAQVRTFFLLVAEAC